MFRDFGGRYDSLDKAGRAESACSRQALGAGKEDYLLARCFGEQVLTSEALTMRSPGSTEPRSNRSLSSCKKQLKLTRK